MRRCRWGLHGAAPGRRAIYVELADHIRLYLRPDTGADISLYPDPPGLAALASGAVTQALPLVLDALASQTGANLQGRVGEIVRSVGDGLNLRSGAPLKFDGTKLQAWATDPVASLVAAVPTLTSGALNAIANALGPALPAGVTANATAGKVTVQCGRRFADLATFSAAIRVKRNRDRHSRHRSRAWLHRSRRQRVEVADGAGRSLRHRCRNRKPATVSCGCGRSGSRRRTAHRIGSGARFGAGTQLVAGRWNIDGAGLGLIAVDGTTTFTDAESRRDHGGGGGPRSDGELRDFHRDGSGAARTIQSVAPRCVGYLDNAVLAPGPGNPPAAPTSSIRRNSCIACRRWPPIWQEPVRRSALAGDLTFGLSKAGPVVQITVGVNGRIPLVQATSLCPSRRTAAGSKDSLLRDCGWRILTPPCMSFAPSLSANGIGIRIGKGSGPLLDLGLSLGSVAVHLYGAIAPARFPVACRCS